MLSSVLMILFQLYFSNLQLFLIVLVLVNNNTDTRATNECKYVEKGTEWQSFINYNFIVELCITKASLYINCSCTSTNVDLSAWLTVGSCSKSGPSFKTVMNTITADIMPATCVTQKAYL